MSIDPSDESLTMLVADTENCELSLFNRLANLSAEDCTGYYMRERGRERKRRRKKVKERERGKDRGRDTCTCSRRKRGKERGKEREGERERGS